MNALTLSATRRRDKVVILSGLSLVSPKCSTPIARRIIRRLFSAWLSAAVAAATITAMWMIALSAPTATDAQRLIAGTCLAAMPWGAVWTLRAFRTLLEHYDNSPQI